MTERLTDLPTPCRVLERSRLASNVERMAGRARTLGVALRPHLKTCKSVDVAAMVAPERSRVAELRVGVYVFQDLFQAGLGICRIEDIALSVLATVIGHKRSHRRLLIDAGGLALSKDRGTAEQPVDRGYGLVARVEDGAVIPGLRVEGCSQEHGVIELPAEADFEAFPVGSRLRILPNHACMTAAAHERYHLVDGDDRVIAHWPRCNFW